MTIRRRNKKVSRQPWHIGPPALERLVKEKATRKPEPLKRPEPAPLPKRRWPDDYVITKGDEP